MRYYSGYLIDDKTSQYLSSGYNDNENYIRINCCGYQKVLSSDVYSDYRNGRLDYQLIYLINGKGFFKFNGTSQKVDYGSLVMYKPAETQYYEYYASDSTEVYWMHATGFGISRFLDELGFTDNNRIINVGLSEEYNILYEKIINELQVKKPAYEQYVNSYFYMLMAAFTRKSMTIEAHAQKNDELNKIIEYMHKNYYTKTTIADYASHYHLSVNKFIVDFKSHKGMTPAEYITNIRITKAKELLYNSSLSINEVASVVGYDDPLYFSRVFKKITGVPPSMYKQE